MILNIFQLNWILIDLVIIALLIIVLISLKWFKLKFRWRKNLSDEALELLNFDFSEICIQNQHIIVKKAFYLKNKNMEDKSKLIIFLFPRKKRKLLYILTEGLASYGYTVVFLNVNFKIKNNKNHDQISKEIKNLYLKISNYFKAQGLPIGFNCSLVSFYSFISLNYLIDSDPNILRLILINPNLKKKYFKKIDDKENLNPKTSLKIYFIFSEKSSFFLKNQYLKNYLNRNSREPAKLLYLETIIKKAKASFKYYETILLGILIDIIDKKSS